MFFTFNMRDWGGEGEIHPAVRLDEGGFPCCLRLIGIYLHIIPGTASSDHGAKEQTSV